MLYLNFEGFTDINRNDSQIDENTLIKTNSVIGFSYDGGRFHASVDGIDLCDNMMADDDFGFRVEQVSHRGKKNQGVVVSLQDFEFKNQESVQSEPDISIDGDSTITFAYDKNRLEIYVDRALVLKTTASNDFSVDIYNV